MNRIRRKFVEIKYFDEVKKLVDEKVYIKASKRALKESVRKFKSGIIKDVRQRYNVKTSMLKSKMKERYGYIGREYAWQLQIASRPLSLTHFGARQTKKGVTVKIKKDRGRKLIPHAFLALNQVFIRETKKRLPIKALKTLSVPQMFKDEIIEVRMKEAVGFYEKRLMHHIDYYLGKK